MKEKAFKLLQDIVYELIEDDALAILISRAVNDHNEEDYNVDEMLRDMRREFRRIWLDLHPTGRTKISVPIYPMLTIENTDGKVIEE